MNKVLIVDDEPVQLRLTEEITMRAGYQVITAANGTEALKALRAEPTIGAVILDLVMPDMDGMGVLEAMKREDIVCPVIVQTASASLDSVVSAMRAGATDYFIKPVAPERLTVSLRNVMRLDRLENSIRISERVQSGMVDFSDMVAAAPAMNRVFDLGRKATANTMPVLIEGEPGSGKQMLARAIHGSSDRSGKPFVSVNCTAFDPALLDRVLFGAAKGSAPGISSDILGKVREAHGGTLYLAEIGNLPDETQEKLLDFIQTGKLVPAGGSPTSVNVRLIAATSRRLLSLTQAGMVREDLYYRLNVMPVYVPPLRDRKTDIEALAERFIARFSAETSARIDGLTEDGMALLQAYDWPGNIRELENAIYRATLLTESAELDRTAFPQLLARVEGRAEAARIAGENGANPSAPVHIDNPLMPRADMPHSMRRAPDRFLMPDGHVSSIAALERKLIAFAIEHYDGHMSKVARHLGIGRSTLYRKLKEYGLESGEETRAA